MHDMMQMHDELYFLRVYHSWTFSRKSLRGVRAARTTDRFYCRWYKYCQWTLIVTLIY